MLINCSNHPSPLWSEKQLKAAAVYGELRDYPYPQISPSATVEDLRTLVDEYADGIETLKPAAVIVAGEFTFCFMLVDRLLKDKVKVICSCSKRRTVEKKNPDGTIQKKALYDFEGFRDYNYY